MDDVTQVDWRNKYYCIEVVQLPVRSLKPPTLEKTILNRIGHVTLSVWRRFYRMIATRKMTLLNQQTTQQRKRRRRRFHPPRDFQYHKKFRNHHHWENRFKYSLYKPTKYCHHSKWNIKKPFGNQWHKRYIYYQIRPLQSMNMSHIGINNICYLNHMSWLERVYWSGVWHRYDVDVSRVYVRPFSLEEYRLG